jgi:hypothetical protein
MEDTYSQGFGDWEKKKYSALQNFTIKFCMVHRRYIVL